jgi:phage-related protein|nr:MAG TPA: tail tape measure protein [Caudoviricetes sp.]
MMGTSFGGTVKLTGESEYRRALSNISNNLKVLSSEMKVVTSQYDTNDKSISNLSKQNEVLSKKIDEQKQKVITLKQALADSKKETGENSTTTQKWQTNLNNAQAELNKLERELNNNKTEIANFGKAEDDVGEKTTRLVDIIKGNLISSAITSGIKALGSAIKQVGSAVLDVGKQALESFANNEQLIGGVETLFKDSAGTVENYANNAYKTAGLSANEYMETVTSFSASLLQSLNGDTAKSAQVADMAITDMSDNANKMGTDMTMIQNAYQGFAKQNYTMLDNLKLGYGGTKEEMQRLLLDAQKITGIKYDISNLNDVYQAIHVIQGELGITGTTAKEASTTIQGSIASMKSAWQNMLTGIATGNSENIGNLVNNLTDSVITAGQNIIPRVQEIINGVVTMLPQIIEKINENLPMLLESGGQIFQTLLNGINSVIPNIGYTAFYIINQFLTGIISNLPLILEMGINLLTELINGISQTLPELIPVAINSIVTMVETLLDNIDMIIDAGIQLILSLAEGLMNALPELIDKIPVIIDKLINAITNNLPKILEMGITLIIKLAEGLIKAIPQLISKIPEIITSLVNGFKNYFSNMSEIGKNLVSGIWEGIKNAKDWLIGKVKEWCGNILDGIKSFFGIHSPSKVFKDEIGTNLALGLGEGFSNTMKDVTQDMSASIPKKFDINTTVSGIHNTNQLNLENITNAFITAVKNLNAQIIIDKDIAGKFVITSVNNSLGRIYG